MVYTLKDLGTAVAEVCSAETQLNNQCAYINSIAFDPFKGMPPNLVLVKTELEIRLARAQRHLERVKSALINQENDPWSS